MEERHLRASAVLLVGALALSALPSAAQSADEPPLTDAEGDAVWYTSNDAAAFAKQSCGLAGQQSQRVCDAATEPEPTRAPPPVGGLQAPPVLDIVWGDLRIEGPLLVGELGLASVTDPLAPLGTGDEAINYQLSWDVADIPGRDGFGANVYLVNGTMQVDAWFFRGDEACVGVGVCYFEPGFELVPGTPGTIRFSIARAALPPDTPRDVELSAATMHATMGTAGALDGYSYSADVRDQQVGGMTGDWELSGADVAGPGRPTPLGPPPPLDILRDRISGRDDPAGDLPVARPDLDILHEAIVETEDSLRISIQIARVDELPEDHLFVIDLHPTTDAYVTAGYVASAGARATFSGICEPKCGPATRVPLTRPAEIEVTPGEPGYVNVTFARRDLGNPAHGDAFDQFIIAMRPPDAGVKDMELPQGGYLSHDRGSYVGDFLWDLQPWWFALGGERPAPSKENVVEVLDPVGDFSTTPSLASLSADLSPFDITSLRATSSTPGVFRIELGIDDLSNVEPPDGYNAIFYGVAFGTEQGPIMMGYYDQPAQKKQQFFCAPDTAVLTQPAGDPNKVIWQPIQGLLSVVRDRGQQVAGSATPGSIVFLVPSSCFGLAPDADLNAESFAAATFLFDPLDEMEPVDTAQSEGPVVVRASTLAPKPFYAEPFGIAEFWNIAGIVVAGLASLVTLLVALKKRGALRRYLHSIEHVMREHAGDTRAREKALAHIQTRLKDDLLKGRILEAHFVIVERRLDASLAKVRTESLGDAFGDLPHRLLVSLQALLSDGAMDREDWQLFRTQLDAEPHLTASSREAILARVEAWVRDAA